MGSFFPMGYSMESARIYESGISAIWSKDFFDSPHFEYNFAVYSEITCLLGIFYRVALAQLVHYETPQRYNFFYKSKEMLKKTFNQLSDFRQKSLNAVNDLPFCQWYVIWQTWNCWTKTERTEWKLNENWTKTERLWIDLDLAHYCCIFAASEKRDPPSGHGNGE